jgi:hypothetical protein
VHGVRAEFEQRPSASLDELVRDVSDVDVCDVISCLMNMQYESCRDAGTPLLLLLKDRQFVTNRIVRVRRVPGV